MVKPYSTQAFNSGLNLREPANDVFTETRKQLLLAEKLRLAGDLNSSAAICEQLVRQHPGYMGALHTLGMLALDRRDWARALGFLVRASMLNPRHSKTLVALSNVYIKMGAPEMAAKMLEAAQEVSPRDPTIHATLGEIYYKQRDYELAAESLREALQLDGTLWAADMRLGQSYVHLGQYVKASESLERVVRAKPDLIDPLLWLADLPAAFLSSELGKWIDRIATSNRAGDADFDSSVHFTRASLLNKIGDPESAWEHMVRGNRIMADIKRDDCSKALKALGRLLEQQRNSQPKAKVGTPGIGRNAISLFILGPSCSGKTTLERLVASLQNVKLGFENPIAENAVRHAIQTAGYLTSEMYELLPKGDEELCRNLYLDELVRKAPDCRVFTNTHPGRIIDVGRIASIVPNVRIVFVKRDVEDLTLRIFMKKYSEGFPFAYDLSSIKSYIGWYYEMIDDLSHKLPGITTLVNYEEVISDPVAVVTRIAGLCGQASPDSIPLVPGDDRGCSRPYAEMMKRS